MSLATEVHKVLDEAKAKAEEVLAMVETDAEKADAEARVLMADVEAALGELKK